MARAACCGEQPADGGRHNHEAVMRAVQSRYAWTEAEALRLPIFPPCTWQRFFNEI